MSETQLYCYECRRSSLRYSNQHQLNQPVCPHCASDFVEVSERPLQGPAEVMLDEQIMHVFDNIAGANFPLGGGGGGGGQDAAVGRLGVGDGLTMLQQALTAMATQGAQVAVHDPNGGPLGNINFGDIVAGAGGMAAFMNQLTMMDPTPDPRVTSQDFRNNLPRKKVPPTADTAASATHVAGTVCKAGDPCSVCHSDFEAESQVVQLPCEHCFHEPCILPWLEMNHTCPVCRAELPSEAPLRPGGRYPGAPENPEEGSDANQRIWDLMQEHGMGQDDFEAMMNEPAAFPLPQFPGPANVGSIEPHPWQAPGARHPWEVADHGPEDSTSNSDDAESGEESSGDEDDDEDGEYDNEDYEQEEEGEGEEEGEPGNREQSSNPIHPATQQAGTGRSEASGLASASDPTSQANSTATASIPNAMAGPSQGQGNQHKLALQRSISQHKAQEDSQARPGQDVTPQRQPEAEAQPQGGAPVPGNNDTARGRRGNIIGAVAAPVGHLLRGAWHIGGAALRFLLF